MPVPRAVSYSKLMKDIVAFFTCRVGFNVKKKFQGTDIYKVIFHSYLSFSKGFTDPLASSHQPSVSNEGLK